MKALPKELFQFFSALAKNNNRNWFEAHKLDFKSLETEMKVFMKGIENTLQIHDKIENAKMFRIYRDVRFSKNKTPYKTHFGMSFHREKPLLRGGYYIHIESDNSFLGVGFWAPKPDDLFRIRKELKVDAEELREIIAHSTFQKYWGALEGDEVKTAPKGFNKEDANIDLIKKKQYTFLKKFTDEEVMDKGFSSQVAIHFEQIRPYFDYMSSILTTDLNGDRLMG